MIFIIEPEIDFVTITVVSVTAARSSLLRFQNWNSKKLILQKRLLSKYIEKLERHLDYYGTLLKFEYKGTQKLFLVIRTAQFYFHRLLFVF